MKDIVDFALSSDENYVQYFLIALVSIMQHSSKNVLYRCHYFYNNISKNSIRKIKKVAFKFKNLELKMYSRCVLNIPDNLNDHGRYSQSSFDRLKFADFFQNLDKLIYLDCDSYIVHDIKELFDIDLKDNYIGAVRDLGCYDLLQNDITIGKRFPKLRNNKYENQTLKEYFNHTIELRNYQKTIYTGTLLMNLKKLRDDNIGNKCIDFIIEKEPVFPDQNALNKICEDKIYFLDNSWCLSYYRAFILDEVDNQVEEDIYQKVRLHPKIFSVKRHHAVQNATLGGGGGA